MTTRLAVYNGALAHLNLRKLSSLADLRTSRLAMDRVWNRAVRECLAAGPWRFAIRTAWLQYEPLLCAEHGYAFAFRKPAQWRRSVAICLDEAFTDRADCFDGHEYLYARVQRIHAKWVTGDVEISRWTSAFETYVDAHLASLIVSELPARGVTHGELVSLAKELHDEALSLEAEQVPIAPRGFRAMTPRADGGGTVRLIG